MAGVEINLPEIKEEEPKPKKIAEKSKSDIIRDFQMLWYAEGLRGGTWQQCTWLGISMLKHPADMMLYAEVLWDTRPDLVIETGTYAGGSALFMATVMDSYGTGHILTIDSEPTTRWHPTHPRISYLGGRSSTDPKVIARVSELVSDYVPAKAGVMVILDSDHARDHVYTELESYADFVTPGCFLVVEDTEINGHPVLESHGPGPQEAVDMWLPENPEFRADPQCEKYLWTAHAWLKKRRL